MSAFVKYLLAFIGVIVVSFFFSGAIGCFIEGDAINIPNMMNGWTFGIFALCILGFLIYMLARMADGKPSLFTSKKKNDKKPDKQFFDSEWLTEKEMNKKYDFCYFRELHSHKSGIPIRAELSQGGLKVNLLHESWHTMIIGTTGSGKTEGFVIPTIQILSSTKTKPSMVISDPKGELYQRNYNKLKKEGYNIRVFDLRNPFSSARWNPMEKAYNAYQRAIHLRKEVKIHNGDNPADCGLKIIAPTYNNEWYEFNGIAYPSREKLDNDLLAMKKQLNDMAYESLNDLALTLCPAQSQTDPSWENGARNFVLGVMLAMLEDSAVPELGMTKDRYNLFNLYKICNIRDADPNKQYATLQKYFEGRSKLSSAAALAGPIINNAQVTTQGFMGLVAQYLNMFADGGICFATSADELKFENLAEGPNALFIKLPDEKESRYPIATMLILQMYKTLVEVANNTDGALPRPVYFILDEFGNFPKIPKLESIITVGRSRKINLMLVVQSYEQVTQKYGQEAALTIKGNCNVHIFLGTTEQKTKEEFSARCGQTSVETTTTNESKGKEGTNTSTSKGLASRALITPDELGLLKNGEMIVSMFKEKAIRSTFTFAYQCSHIYDFTPHQEEYAPARFLDENKVYYDIKERNKLVLNNNNFNFN